ncbi:acyl-CoA dehydrogenase [Tianweitania sp. BSSL-BM11]|uniref:Acyl-CoA dehydrogenase n=1 Tax=Tianweitania aestuarii TaxID=2814886 RepID=A0ABS5RXT5_9HYPH|nr:acyl-CoA dehydrogenase family protein [Tianweitania aestuarii]MBS9721142.1 acyl-CoA dehydrogenase [Tianweitania aestuarii]
MDMADNDMAGIINEQAQRLFEGTVTRDQLTAADNGDFQATLWAQVGEAGLPLALLLEEAGGIALDPVQAFELIRSAAYYAVPLPLGETMLVAALLNEASEGPASLAHGQAGQASRVPYGQACSRVLVENNNGWRVFERDQITGEAGRNLAGEPRDALHLQGDGRSVERPQWLGDEGLAAVGALLRAVQMSGAMRRALDLGVAHATERKQFGRPIAAFQAVQHMLADAAVQVASASAIADNAAQAWGKEDFVVRAALAKVRTGEAASLVARVTHQVHAAMGITQEHSLHFYTRRLWSWRDEFGSDAYWAEWIGQAVCKRGGAALWPSLVAATS